jgi:molybdopterin molybdotransferase
MPEFLRLVPPDEARARLFSHLVFPEPAAEAVDTASALGRVTLEDIRSPHPLPEFSRSTVDGYAVRAGDTFGATESLPSYLTLVGEVPMGASPTLALGAGECALIHTGGMLPEGADAVVMLEHTQLIPWTKDGPVTASPTKLPAPSGRAAAQDLEAVRATAVGENVIHAGEDVEAGQVVVSRGVRLRPAEIGGLMALGITSLRVAAKPRVGLISSGDEVVEPGQRPAHGQVRDVNAYALGSLISKCGGEPVLYGIVPDDKAALRQIGAGAVAACHVVVITAGSSASTRDMTADVIASLGAPGVVVHGINTRPGKPTILGVCGGKAVLGLPGNPVSALVNAYLFVVPLVERLLGLPLEMPRPSVQARLTVNLPSQAGREDWWPVRLSPEASPAGTDRDAGGLPRSPWNAEPIFGKSNLIFNLVRADGLVRIPPDATGFQAGELVLVYLL